MGNKSFQKVVFRPWADTHAGETAVVIGHGKSLNDVPRELLNKYPSFGCNHIYQFDFQPTYYVCVDEVVLREHPKDIYATVAQAKIAFLHDDFRGEHIEVLRELYELPNVYLYNKYVARFADEIWPSGGTVTYVALKIAYVMGFNTVLLVGCDRDKEWSHFSNDYPAFGSRSEYFLRTQEYHLKIAGEVYKEAGKRIVNLSLPSVLDEYFERGNVEDYA